MKLHDDVLEKSTIRFNHMSQTKYTTGGGILQSVYWDSFTFITDNLPQVGNRGWIFLVHCNFKLTDKKKSHGLRSGKYGEQSIPVSLW
ncbi:hypothetical protein AVEN_224386-1 [Araneus ventricosus]|uniref:Uncharacterized protein n=1 Tax=Araneus ventricosus TaxID=182803 RepID=A0A4Y2FAV0_ARAVE|nr:hypothetical protein AVEN_224386-1 [Araneus ventricosus]